MAVTDVALLVPLFLIAQNLTPRRVRDLQPVVELPQPHEPGLKAVMHHGSTGPRQRGAGEPAVLEHPRAEAERLAGVRRGPRGSVRRTAGLRRRHADGALGNPRAVHPAEQRAHRAEGRGPGAAPPLPPPPLRAVHADAWADDRRAGHVGGGMPGSMVWAWLEHLCVAQRSSSGQRGPGCLRRCRRLPGRCGCANTTRARWRRG